MSHGDWASEPGFDPTTHGSLLGSQQDRYQATKSLRDERDRYRTALDCIDALIKNRPEAMDALLDFKPPIDRAQSYARTLRGIRSVIRELALEETPMTDSGVGDA